MLNLTRIIVSFALLVVAVCCYLIGSATGVFLIVVAGFILELVFWLGLFGFSKANKGVQVHE